MILSNSNRNKCYVYLSTKKYRTNINKKCKIEIKHNLKQYERIVSVYKTMPT